MSRLLACSLGLCLWLGPSVAVHAQATAATGSPVTSAAASTGAPAPSKADVARARTLFQRGLELAQKQDFRGAAKRFSEALALHYAPAVEYNLASALYEAGQYDASYNRTQNVLAQQDTPANVRGMAERLERTLHPYVARLTVLTSGESQDVSVTIDGAALAPALLGRPQAVPPGPHEIIAKRGETVISRRKVQLALRTAAIVEVSLVLTPQMIAAGNIAVSAQSESEAAPLAPAPDRVDESASRRKLRLWSGVAAGAVVLAAGVATAIALANRGHDQTQAPVPGNSGVLTW